MDRKKDEGRLSYCRLSLDDTNQMNLQLYEMALILYLTINMLLILPAVQGNI